MIMKATGWAGCSVVLSLVACNVFESGHDGSTPREGGVDRRYSKAPDVVANAAEEVLRELDVTIEANQHDALGGELKGLRGTPGKEEIVVWYKSLDPRTTQVSVLVGKGDRHLGDLVQDHIAQKLGEASSTGTPVLGAVAEGLYDPPMGQCLTAMEQSIRDLKMNVTHREVHDTWALIESSEANAIPIRAKIERMESDKTRVTVIAGTTRSYDTQQLADRLKANFEQRINPESVK